MLPAFPMHVRVRSLLLAVGMAASLAACGNGEEAVEAVRPAMVERPLPAGTGFEAFPGDVRARHEPVLAFRVGGKIAKRHVDAGARVKQGEVLAELDPDDLRLQVAAVRGTMMTLTRSPATSSGTPTAATSLTSGCMAMTSSISLG